MARWIKNGNFALVSVVFASLSLATVARETKVWKPEPFGTAKPKAPVAEPAPSPVSSAPAGQPPSPDVTPAVPAAEVRPPSPEIPPEVPAPPIVPIAPKPKPKVTLQLPTEDPTQEMIRNVYDFIMWVRICYFLAANTSYFFIIVMGYYNAYRRYAEKHLDLVARLSALRVLSPVSILVPCYNEELSITRSILSMLQLNYPEFEVIVCNDGSKDRSVEVLKESFNLFAVDAKLPQVLPCKPIRAVYISKDHPNLIVLDKENGGKADALNAAINHSKYPLICCVDSDSVLEAEGLARVTVPFFEDPDQTIATGGTILTVNTSATGGASTAVPATWLGCIQAMEYLRAFLIGRLAWDFINCNTIISGAFGVFKKSLVIKVGGYAHKTIGEDMELLLRMQTYCLEAGEKYRVQLLPDPVCWTEAPSDLKTLGNQRSRWQQGLCESLWRTRKVFFRSWSGRIGWLGLPYLAFFEMLSGPLEIISFPLAAFAVYMGYSDVRWTLLYLGVNPIYGGILNIATILVDQATFKKFPRLSDIVKLLVGAIVEHVGFRQLHLYWRVRGLWRWSRGNHSWGAMVRTGLGPTPAGGKT